LKNTVCILKKQDVEKNPHQLMNVRIVILIANIGRMKVIVNVPTIEEGNVNGQDLLRKTVQNLVKTLNV